MVSLRDQRIAKAQAVRMRKSGKQIIETAVLGINDDDMVDFGKGIGVPGPGSQPMA